MRPLLFAVLLLSIAVQGHCEKKDGKKTEKRGVMDEAMHGARYQGNINGELGGQNTNENRMNQGQGGVLGYNLASIGYNENNFRDGIRAGNTGDGVEAGTAGVGDQNDASRTTFNTITQRIPVPVPQPYPVNVPRLIQVNVPQPVHVSLLRSYSVQIPHPDQVTVPKPYPIPVNRPVPQAIPVPQPHLVPVPVPQPYPINIAHPIPVVPIPHQITASGGDAPLRNAVGTRSADESGDVRSNIVETGPGKDVQQEVMIGGGIGGIQKSFAEENGANSFDRSVGHTAGEMPSSGSGHENHGGNIGSSNAGGIFVQHENGNNGVGNRFGGGQGYFGNMLGLQKESIGNNIPLNVFDKNLGAGLGSLQISGNSGLFGGSFLGSGIRNGFGSGVGNPIDGSIGGHGFSLGNTPFGSNLNSYGGGHGFSFGSGIDTFSALANNHGLALGAGSLPSFLGFGNGQGLLPNAFGSGGFSLKQ